MERKPLGLEAIEPSLPTTTLETAAVKQRRDRRALLRLSAGAAPVLLTLPSAPVGAAQLCVLASSYVSPNTFASHNAFLGNTMQCTVTSGVISTYMTEAYNAKNAAAAAVPPVAMPSPWGDLVSSRMGTSGASGVPGYDTMTVADALHNGGSLETTTPRGLLQHLLALSIAISKGDSRNPSTPYHGNFDTAYVASVWHNVASNGFSTFTGGGLNWPMTNVIAWARTAMGLYGSFV